MSTKNFPGQFDCIAKADPNEPMFVLLGRDPAAPFVVQFWIKMREVLGQEQTDPQILEAGACAREMEAWALSMGKSPQVIKALQAFVEVLRSGGAVVVKMDSEEATGAKA